MPVMLTSGRGNGPYSCGSRGVAAAEAAQRNQGAEGGGPTRAAGGIGRPGSRGGAASAAAKPARGAGAGGVWCAAGGESTPGESSARCARPGDACCGLVNDADCSGLRCPASCRGQVVSTARAASRCRASAACVGVAGVLRVSLLGVVQADALSARTGTACVLLVRLLRGSWSQGERAR